jgi:hypothetical protein
MRFNKRPFLQILLRAAVLAASPAVDARGPSRLRLRLHRLRAQTSRDRSRTPTQAAQPLAAR